MCGNSRDRGDSRKSSSDHGSTWSAIFKKGKGKVDRPQLGLNATVEGPSRVSSARPIDDINLHGPRADPNVAPIPAPLSDNVSQTTKLRDAIERLNAAVKLLHKVIAMFDTTTDPDADLRRTQLSLPESNKTLDKSIKDIDVIVSLLIDKTQTPGRSEDTLAKLGYAVEDLCRAITPFLKNVLAVTIPASAIPILNPYGVLCTGISLFIQLLEADCRRKSALRDELANIHVELERIKLAKLVPRHFKEVTGAVHVNAFATLEAMVNLIGRQLTYFKTYAKKLGRVVNSVFTEAQEHYQNAIENLVKNLQSFNRSLDDADFVIGINTYVTVEQLLARQAERDFGVWLSPPDGNIIGSRFYFQSGYDVELERQTVGTCEWLFEHDTFARWANELTPGMLWIRGASSTGKSVAMASAIAKLISMNANMRVRHYDTIYFFCSQVANDTNRTGYTAILRSFLFQLWRLTKDDAQLTETWNAIRLDAGKPGILDSEPHKWKYWSKMLHCVVGALSKLTYIIVDAVDECDKPEDLLSELHKLVDRHDRVKILFSSRPDIVDLAEFMEDIPTITIVENITNKDMSRHIRTVLEAAAPALKRWSFTFTEEFGREIENTLIEKADGMFLWASWHIKNIVETQGWPSEARIRSYLDRVPEGLNATFKHSLARIEKLRPMDRDFARSILLWTAYARRPLCLEEVITAAFNADRPCSQNPERPEYLQKNLISRSSFQLLEVVGSVVKFRHVSVKTFLLSEPLWVPDSVNKQDSLILSYLQLVRDGSRANMMMAKVCLTYLLAPCFCGPESDETKFTSSGLENTPSWEDEDYDASQFASYTHSQYPLIAYASCHIGSHIKKIEMNSGAVEVHKLLYQFLYSQALSTWLSISSVLISNDDSEWFSSLVAIENTSNDRNTQLEFPTGLKDAVPCRRIGDVARNLWLHSRHSYQRLNFYFRVARIFASNMGAVISPLQKRQMIWDNIYEVARLGKEPEDGQTLHNFGMTVFFLTNDKSRALEPLREAIECNPAEERFRRGYVTACHSSGKYEDIFILKSRLGEDAFHDDLLECLTRGYQQIGKHVEAVALWIDRSRTSKDRQMIDKILHEYSQKWESSTLESIKFWKILFNQYPHEKAIQLQLSRALSRKDRPLDFEELGILMREHNLNVFETDQGTVALRNRIIGVGARDTMIQFWKSELVDALANCPEAVERKIQDLRNALRNPDEAIDVWKSLLRRFVVYKLVLELQCALDRKADQDLSIAVWKDLVEQRSDAWQFRDYLQFALNRAGDKDKRIAVWLSMVEQNIDRSDLCLQLRLALQANEDHDQEISVWKTLLEQHLEHRNLAIQLRDSLERKGNKDEAVSIWQELVLRHPASLHLKWGLVKALEWKGETEEGIAIWKRLLCANPGVKWIYQGLLESLEKTTAARAISVLKDLSGCNPEKWEVQMALAEAYERDGNSEESMSLWNMLLKRYPNEQEIKKRGAVYEPDYASGRDYSMVWASKIAATRWNESAEDVAESLERGMAIEQVIDRWKDVVRKYPGTAWAPHMLDRALRRKQSPADAVNAWKSLVRKYPSAWGFQARLAKAYKWKGDDTEALAGWTELLEGYPDDRGLQEQVRQATHILKSDDFSGETCKVDKL